jgi:hypothetical protein
VGAFSIGAAEDATYLVQLDAAPSVTSVNHASAEAMAEVCSNFAVVPGVLRAQPNLLYSGSLEPNDPLFTHENRNGFIEMNAPAAWDITTGSSDIIVAVLDSGVTPHPELAGRLLPGYDFFNDDADPSDDHGHGSHVAGIVAATGNNGVGSMGVAWGVKVLPVKVLGTTNIGTTAAVISGIQYAADNGAQIINLSLGQLTDDPALHAAVQYALAAGSLPIAAVGNDGRELKAFPAAYPEVLAVGANWTGRAYAGFSNFGHWVDISAPGLDIRSLENDGSGFEEKSGTSMATPMVAGAATLVLSVAPSLTPHELRARLLRTAHGAFYDNPANSEHRYNSRLGAGSLDVNAAVRNLSERDSIVQISFSQGGDPVVESLLERGETYDVSVTVENVAPFARAVTVEVLSADPLVGITGGGPRILNLATGVPVLETGFTVSISSAATPNLVRPLTVRVTPSGGSAEVHDFVISTAFDLVPGWPQTIPECLLGVPATDPAFVTMTDGVVRIYQANTSFDTIHSYAADGSPLLTTYATPEVLYSPLAANLTSDADEEIVFPVASSIDGAFIWAIGSDHSTLSGWPVPFEGFASGKTGMDLEAATRISAADLDNDGYEEIIIAESRLFKTRYPWSTGGAYQTRVYALRPNGTLMPGWPQFIDGQISLNFPPAVGDTTGDGIPEIVVPIDTVSQIVSTSEMNPAPPPVMVFSADGVLVRTLTPSRGAAQRCGFGAQGVALADFDMDGAQEIVRHYGGCGINVWKSDGSQLPGFPTVAGQLEVDVPPGINPDTRGGSPSVADIDGDGSLDIAVTAGGFKMYGTGTWDPVDYTTTLLVVASNGVSLSGFPKLLETIPYPHQSWAQERGSDPLLIDLDGDGNREIFTQSRVLGALFGFDKNGLEVEGFPIRFRKVNAGTTPFSFADIDRDGSFELLTGADLADALTIYDLPFQYAASSDVAINPEFAPWPRAGSDTGYTSRSSDAATTFLPGTPVPTVTPIPTPTATPLPTPTRTPTPIASPPAQDQLVLSAEQLTNIRNGWTKIRFRARVGRSGTFSATDARVDYQCVLGAARRTGLLSVPAGGILTRTLSRVLPQMRCTFKARKGVLRDSVRVVLRRKI